MPLRATVPSVDLFLLLVRAATVIRASYNRGAAGFLT